MNTSKITSTIIEALNTIFGNMFSSIDTNIYYTLDEITFINGDILNSPYFEKIFGISSSNSILLIANALLIGFVLYYSIKLILSNLAITPVENPYSFIFRTIFFGICMNFSYYICDQIISLNFELSMAIKQIGEEVFNTEICFANLIEKLNSVIYTEQNSMNIFSIDGIIKSTISFGFFNLIFSYSIRYILIKLFILISPFAILSLSTQQTSSFCKSWFKCFLSLLFIQDFVALTLILIYSIELKSNDLLSKFLFIGCIFVLIKANSYVREFMGGLSTEFQTGINNFKSLIK